jgi:type VI secretion system secreted protein VgrG
LQSAVTSFSGFDYKAKSVVSVSLATHREFAGKALSGEASLLESYDYAGPYAFATPDEAEHYARLCREALEARFKTRFGISSVRTFRPGFAFDLVGGVLATPEENRFLVTAITHAGENNLPRETLERARQLFGDDQEAEGGEGADAELASLAHEHGYANRFEAIRADVPWRPILADDTGARLNPRPTAFGVQSAIVVGPAGECAPSGADELYTDKLGRVKVRFHWQRAESDQDRSTCWLRVAQRMAGPGYGSQWIPRIGQEVLVGFLENDIDRPIVLGALYNGQGEAGSPPSPNGESRTADTGLYAQASDHRPSAQANLAAGMSPAWHAAAPGDAAHRNAGALSGFKTKEFGGAGTNQLVFDDSDGQLRTQAASSHACSQLNLGHLIHQQDNYRGSFRGAGFELRTDAYGALRAGNGVLISSYAAPASGPAGDAAPAMALAKAASGLAQTFSQAAGTHKTVKLSACEGSVKAKASVLNDKAAPLPALHQSLSGMVDGKAFDEANADAGKRNTATAKKTPHTADPLIGLAAKAGLSLTAAEGQLWANGEDIAWSCGDDMSLAVAQALRMHSGQAIGMLAGAIGAGEGSAGTGLTLIAAQGKIEMQAQADTLSIQARDEVNVQSANASIDFAAAKSIKLKVAGGAAIEISGGNITVKAPGTITVNATMRSFNGPSSVSREMNTWATSKFDEEFILELDNGKPATNQTFEIHREDGVIIRGKSDANGRTGLQKSQFIGALAVLIKPSKGTV